jgi:hypothetical protein
MTPRADVARSFVGRTMSQILVLFAILAAWVILQRWVLPRFGIQT